MLRSFFLDLKSIIIILYYVKYMQRIFPGNSQRAISWALHGRQHVLVDNQSTYASVLKVGGGTS